MPIGYHQLVITPDFTNPVYLAGFANNRVATHVYDISSHPHPHAKNIR